MDKQKHESKKKRQATQMTKEIHIGCTLPCFQSTSTQPNEAQISPHGSSSYSQSRSKEEWIEAIYLLFNSRSISSFFWAYCCPIFPSTVSFWVFSDLVFHFLTFQSYTTNSAGLGLANLKISYLRWEILLCFASPFPSCAN